MGMYVRLEEVVFVEPFSYYSLHLFQLNYWLTDFSCTCIRITLALALLTQLYDRNKRAFNLWRLVFVYVVITALVGHKFFHAPEHFLLG